MIFLDRIRGWFSLGKACLLLPACPLAAQAPDPAVFSLRPFLLASALPVSVALSTLGQRAHSFASCDFRQMRSYLAQ